MDVSSIDQLVYRTARSGPRRQNHDTTPHESHSSLHDRQLHLRAKTRPCVCVLLWFLLPLSTPPWTVGGRFGMVFPSPLTSAPVVASLGTQDQLTAARTERTWPSQSTSLIIYRTWGLHKCVPRVRFSAQRITSKCLLAFLGFFSFIRGLSSSHPLIPNVTNRGRTARTQEQYGVVRYGTVESSVCWVCQRRTLDGCCLLAINYLTPFGPCAFR